MDSLSKVFYGLVYVHLHIQDIVKHDAIKIICGNSCIKTILIILVILKSIQK